MGAIFAGVESRAINRTILFRNLEGFTPPINAKILKFMKSVTLALNYALTVCLHVDPVFRHCELNSGNSIYDSDESIKYIARKHKQFILMYRCTSDKLAVYGQVIFNSKTQAHRPLHCKCPKKKHELCTHMTSAYVKKSIKVYEFTFFTYTTYLVQRKT